MCAIDTVLVSGSELVKAENAEHTEITEQAERMTRQYAIVPFLLLQFHHASLSLFFSVCSVISVCSVLSLLTLQKIIPHLSQNPADRRLGNSDN
jgi:hypothetical protein